MSSTEWNSNAVTTVGALCRNGLLTWNELMLLKAEVDAAVSEMADRQKAHDMRKTDSADKSSKLPFGNPFEKSWSKATKWRK